MISFSSNPIFFTAMILGTLGFAIAVFRSVHYLEKDHKKKPHKHKKA